MSRVVAAATTYTPCAWSFKLFCVVSLRLYACANCTHLSTDIEPFVPTLIVRCLLSHVIVLQLTVVDVKKLHLINKS